MRSPLRPAGGVFFITMLMIPEVPSGVNRADGLVITSIFSIPEAGSCCRTSDRLRPISGDFFPLTRIMTSPDPRRLTFPSKSTWTEGMFCSTSLAELDRAIRSWSTLYTRRSSVWWNNSRSAEITTSSNANAEALRETVCSAMRGLASVSVNTGDR